ncbi:MAG TPA: hypothetical protein VLA16_24860 [Ideonella sp.]|nr:hypothetical protein [Ideonella sp.]
MKQDKLRQWTYRAALCGVGAVALGHLVNPPAAQAQSARQVAPAAARQPAAVVDLRSTVDQTAAVVEGVVADIRHEYSDEDGPWTRVMLSDVKAHFGVAPASVEIRHFGGPLPNGRAVVAAELPVFVPGKRYVVFLRNTAWNLSPVVGSLALRVETVGGAEALVDSDGRAVTGVGLRGVEMGPALFEGPQYDGSQPKALVKNFAALARQPLDRRGLVRALKAGLAAHGLSVAGSFDERPAGGFKWRATATSASPGHQPAAGAASPQTASAAAEVDTSGPTEQ